MRIPWCFFSHWTTPSRSHGDFFQRNWGYWVTWKNRDEPEMRVQQWRKTTGRIRHVRPTVKGSSDLWNYTKLWFMRLQEDPTNWWWDSVVFLGFSVLYMPTLGSFNSGAVSWASQVAWWSTSMRKIRPRGWTWRKKKLSPRYVANPMHHTSNPFPVLF